MADIQCVVLAGGLGTRMSRLTSTTPKALIEVSGQPFLRRKLAGLRLNGITDVVISTGYLGEQIEQEVATHSPTGMSVTCVPDGPSLLGTAGALRRIADLGLLDNTFLVTYGDNYLTCDHQWVAASFDPSTYDALMTVWRVDTPDEPRNVVVREGRVDRYDKTHTDPEMLWVDYGLCVLTRDIIIGMVPSGTEGDLAVVLASLAADRRLQALEVEERYFEIGSEEGLAEVVRLFAAKGLS